MKISIELRANDGDLKGLQYISGQVNAIIQSARSISDIQSFNSGPKGIGYTIDATFALTQQIADLQAQTAVLTKQLTDAQATGIVTVTPIPSTNPIPVVVGVTP